MKRGIEPFGNGRVRLRLITEADLETTLRWRNRDDVRIWFRNSQVIAPEQHRAWFARYLARDDDYVFVVEADGRPAGQASVYGIVRAEGVAEVGRFIAAPEVRGRGYISLACGELLRCCAETLGLNYVFLEVKEENRRAIGIYVRHGFREESRDGGMIRMGRRLKQEAGAAGAGDAQAADR